MSGKRPPARKSRASERMDEEWRELADDLIARIGRGDLSWKREWAMLDPARNPITGAYYQGTNIALLYRAMVAKRTVDPRFCGFEQAKSRGWKIRKGASGVPIGHFSTILVDADGKRVKGQGSMTPEEKAAYIESHEGARTIGVNKTLYVFSLSEMEGAPPYEMDKRRIADLPVVDELIDHSPCKVDEVPGERACYIPAIDRIVMPERWQFLDAEGLVSTLLHEQVHATGHPSRLKREIENKFGSEKYAREELVAELGSVFAYSRLGLKYPELQEAATDAGMENRAAYLMSWAASVGDPVEAVQAVVGDAARAAKFIVDLHPPTLSQERDEQVSERMVEHEDADSLSALASAAREAARTYVSAEHTETLAER